MYVCVYMNMCLIPGAARDVAGAGTGGTRSGKSSVGRRGAASVGGGGMYAVTDVSLTSL